MNNPTVIPKPKKKRVCKNFGWRQLQTWTPKLPILWHTYFKTFLHSHTGGGWFWIWIEMFSYTITHAHLYLLGTQSKYLITMLRKRARPFVSKQLKYFHGIYRGYTIMQPKWSACSGSEMWAIRMKHKRKLRTFLCYYWESRYGAD